MSEIKVDEVQEEGGARALQERVVLGGKYELIKPIGKGKFAVVYRARRIEDAEIVALKKIAVDSMGDQAREKCLKEVRILQSLEHPNIIRYLDSMVEGDELVIAFEWAAAGDLKRQIRKAVEREKRFEERLIWKYFAQICDALSHMHKRRILHRDLKPANVFLTLDGTVKVGDLGLGRMMSEHTLEAHSKVGTPLYMSPEVLRGDGYDWKSDVWSLGCVLYELAVLRSPFKAQGLNLYSLFQKISRADYDPVPESYSTELRQLAHAMLNVEPAQRPDVNQAGEVAARMRREKTIAAATQRAQAELPCGDERRQSTDNQLKDTVNKARTSERRSLNEAVPEHIVLVKSEAAVEKLALLGFASARRASGRDPILRTHFSLQGCGRGISRQQQFADLASAVAFVMERLGGDTEFIGEVEDAPPMRAATSLLNSATKKGYQGSARPHEIATGFGPAVCDLLEWLLDLALEACSFEPPDYSQLQKYTEDESSPDDIDLEDYEVDDEASFAGEDIDDLFAPMAEVSIEPARKVITTAIDVQAWALEVERVAPRLRTKDREARQLFDWSTRLEACRRGMATIEASVNARTATAALGRRLRNVSDAVVRAETTLNAHFEQTAKIYANNADIRSDLARRLGSTTERIADRMDHLNHVQTQLNAAMEGIRQRSDAITDPSKLTHLRKALADLKSDIAKLDLSLGISLFRYWSVAKGRYITSSPSSSRDTRYNKD